MYSHIVKYTYYNTTIRIIIRIFKYTNFQIYTFFLCASITHLPAMPTRCAILSVYVFFPTFATFI